MRGILSFCKFFFIVLQLFLNNGFCATQLLAGSQRKKKFFFVVCTVESDQLGLRPNRTHPRVRLAGLQGSGWPDPSLALSIHSITFLASVKLCRLGVGCIMFVPCLFHFFFVRRFLRKCPSNNHFVDICFLLLFCVLICLQGSVLILPIGDVWEHMNGTVCAVV